MKNKIQKNRFTILPMSKMGKWAFYLFMATLLLYLIIFFLAAFQGEDSSDSITGNLKIFIIGTVMILCGVLSFILGLISIIKHKERSIIVIIATSIGFLYILLQIGDILFFE